MARSGRSATRISQVELIIAEPERRKRSEKNGNWTSDLKAWRNTVDVASTGSPGVGQEASAGYPWSADIREIAVSVNNSGWFQGVSDFINILRPEKAKYYFRGLFEFSQGGWSILLDLPEGSRTLSIDPNLGATAIALARYGGQVVSLQTSQSLAKAVTSRIQSEDIGNIELVVGNIDDRLLCEGESFDLVCLHLAERVLDLHGCPESRYGDVIRRLIHIVKPSGTLYVGGQKKCWRDSFPDAGIGAILGAISAIRKGGFHIDFVFDVYMENGNPEILRTFMPFGWGFSPFKFAKFLLFSDNYGIVARRSGRIPANPVRGILERLCIPQVPSGLNTREIRYGSDGVLRIETTDRIFKFPRTREGLKGCQSNHDALKQLQERVLTFGTPLPLEFSLHPVPYFAEERLSGIPVDYLNLSSRQMQRYSEQAIGILDELQCKTVRRGVLDDEAYRMHFEEPLQVLKYGSTSEEAVEIETWGGKAKKRFLGIPFSSCFGHGDFKIANFLRDRTGRIVGVVDWDRSGEDVPVGIDDITLLAFGLSVTRKCDYLSAMFSLPYDMGMFGALLRERCGDRELEKFWVVLSALRYFRFVHRSVFMINDWRKWNVAPFVNFLKALEPG